MIGPHLSALMLIILSGSLSADPGAEYNTKPKQPPVGLNAPPSLDRHKTPSLQPYSPPALVPYSQSSNRAHNDPYAQPPIAYNNVPPVPKYQYKPEANRPIKAQSQERLTVEKNEAERPPENLAVEGRMSEVLTDRDAISQEIDRIDEAIADIDTAIKSTGNQESQIELKTVEIQPNNDGQENVKSDISSDTAETMNEESDVTVATDSDLTSTVAKEDEGVKTESSVDPEVQDQVMNDVAPESESTPQEEPARSAGSQVETVKTDAGVDEKSVVGPEETKILLEKFRHNEELYKRHPPQPIDTRRMFDHKPGIVEFKISSLSRFRKFIKENHMGGSVSDNENMCNKEGLNCDPEQQYRTFDGTCNNLEQPSLGSTDMPYQRLLEPAYADGDSLPRGASDWSEETGYVSSLPSSRTISDTVFSQGNESLSESGANTHMLMQWGQFIDHDLVSTSKESFDCCHPEIKNLCRCFSISVQETDSWYSQFGKTCLDFTRSDHHCKSGLKHAEQFNKVTSFLDGSHIYGTNKEFAMKLRGGDRRKQGLLLQNSQLSHFLPSKFDMHMRGSDMDRPSDFVAGDDRCETQASLTSMHNLLFNEHNRIAEQLYQELKPRSSLSEPELDEIVYQETRRLVIAEIQHFTYNHFLPQVIGDASIKAHKLLEPECVYDPQADPTMINSFVTAAFRFGHSLIQSIFRGENQPWRLGKFFADSRFARGDGGKAYVNELIGLSKQPCQKADVHITKQMTQMLYSNNKTEPGGGHDIGSTNIQRGRDHGIPSYNQFRTLCGLPSLESLTGETPQGLEPEAWQRIGQVYTSVDQIDLFVGGLAETPAGGIVGPTFACIIGKQFKASMDGDRFFYHHTDGPNIFPLKGAAKREIEGRTLAHVICEVTNTEEMSTNVFVQESSTNPRKPCSDFKSMDFKSIAAEIKM